MLDRPGGRYDVFLSYTRADSEGWTALIHSELEKQLRPYQWTVFKDNVNTMPGQNWSKRLQRLVDRSRVFIPIIGDDWHSERVEHLFDKRNWVRREIMQALAASNDKKIIPLILNGRKVPSTDALPEEVKPLLNDWQAVFVSGDSEKLKQEIEVLVGKIMGKSPVSAPVDTRLDRELAPLDRNVEEGRLFSAYREPSHQRWHPLVAGYPPAWANGWGEDDYGVFVDVKLNGFRFRLRWIPPGQFFIGSPKTEPGRYDDEGPGAQISFSKGYWLMDTPVTQALWEVVMGENPSQFQSPDRPVEQVSWNDVQDFLLKMNNRVEGLSLRLPSESEWEYACRGGTEEATYAGAIDIKGERNAPVLDAIAWYGGNSGIDFELEEGHESSEWPEKQYEHSKAGTHPVGKKNPNRWGCYDMLGNVWEWCEDVWSESHEGIDIKGSPRIGSSDEKGEARVVRGGSWGSGARFVRAACRDGVEPGSRNGFLGFRCVLGQSSTVARDERLLSADVAEPRADASIGKEPTSGNLFGRIRDSFKSRQHK